MNENQEHILDFEALTARVLALRSHVNTDIDLLFVWQDYVNAWDSEFKTRLKEKYGDTRFAQQVPAWQVLVGGSVEKEVDITTEQREFINKEVERILNQFVSEHDIPL